MDVSDSDLPLPIPKRDLSVFTVVEFSLNKISFKLTQMYFNTCRYIDYFSLDWYSSIWASYVNFAAVRKYETALKLICQTETKILVWRQETKVAPFNSL